MTVQKLSTTDAFIVVDFPDAPRSDGVVRCAKKVLVDSTRSLARARTYAWALLGQQVGGVSGAINALGDGRSEAVEAFAAELAPRVADGSLTLGAGKGLSENELSGLGAVRTRDTDAFVAGILACASTAHDMDGARVAIEFDGGVGEALTTALQNAGAEVVAHGPEALDVSADVLLFGSRPGVIDHERAAELSPTLLVPTGDLPFTPRALAVAGRRGINVLPDFLTTSGALAAEAGLDPVQALTERTAAALQSDEGPVVGACRMAEDFLSTWVQELPFGRPLA